MFGGNKQVPQHLTDGLHLRVQSVFPTIQGEGPYSGYPALFIRLHGCNLRCTFCDTDFESVQQQAEIGMLASRAKLFCGTHKFPLVVLTGGEPLLQNVVPLIHKLTVAGIHCQIETAGTVWVPDLEQTGAQLVCSPKTANVHRMISGWCLDWKYIIRVSEQQSAVDGLPICATQFGHSKPAALARPGHPNARIFLQPCEEYRVADDGARVADLEATAANTARAAELCMCHGYRLSLQTHKIIGLP